MTHVPGHLDKPVGLSEEGQTYLDTWDKAIAAGLRGSGPFRPTQPTQQQIDQWTEDQKWALRYQTEQSPLIHSDSKVSGVTRFGSPIRPTRESVKDRWQRSGLYPTSITTDTQGQITGAQVKPSWLNYQYNPDARIPETPWRVPGFEDLNQFKRPDTRPDISEQIRNLLYGDNTPPSTTSFVENTLANLARDTANKEQALHEYWNKPAELIDDKVMGIPGDKFRRAHQSAVIGAALGPAFSGANKFIQAATTGGKWYNPLKLLGQGLRGWTGRDAQYGAPYLIDDIYTRAKTTDLSGYLNRADDSLISPKDIEQSKQIKEDMNIKDMSEMWTHFQEDIEAYDSTIGLGDAEPKPLTASEARFSTLLEVFQNEPASNWLTALQGADPDSLTDEEIERQHKLEDYKASEGDTPTKAEITRRMLGSPFGLVWDSMMGVWQETAQAIGAAYYLADRYGVQGLNPFTNKVHMGSEVTEKDYARAQEIGEDYFHTKVPLDIQFLGPFLTDPLRGITNPVRFVKNRNILQNRVIEHIVKTSDTLDDVLDSVKTGKAFYSQPLARLAENIPVLKSIIARQTATAARLLHEEAGQTLRTFTVGRNADEIVRIIDGFKAAAKNDMKTAERLLSDFSSFVEGPLSAAEAGYVQLGVGGINKTDSVVRSLLNSSAGKKLQLQFKIIDQMPSATVAKLLTTIHEGLGTPQQMFPTLFDDLGKFIGKNKDDLAEMVVERQALGETAAATLGELFLKASQDLVGYVRKGPPLKGGTPVETVAGILSLPGMVMPAIQGGLARLSQLNTVGRIFRDGTVSITEMLLDNTGGIIPPGFYKNYGAMPPGGLRGLGAGGEHLQQASQFADDPSVAYASKPYVTGLWNKIIGKKTGPPGTLSGRTIGKWEKRGLEGGDYTHRLLGPLGRVTDIILERPGTWKAMQENVFAQQAIYKGINETFRQLWRPQLAVNDITLNALRAKLGPVQFKTLFRMLEAEWNPTAYPKLLKDFLGGQANSIPRKLLDNARKFHISSQVKNLTNATNLDELNTIYLKEQARIFTKFKDKAATANPPLPTQFDETFRRVLREAGWEPHLIEKEIERQTLWRAATRGEMEFAKATTFEKATHITDKAIEMRERARLDILSGAQNDASTELAGWLAAEEVKAKKLNQSITELKRIAWTGHFDDWSQRWYKAGLELDQHISALLQLDDDAVRTIGSNLKYTSVEDIIQTGYHKHFDDYFNNGGKASSAAADVIDPIMSDAVAAPLQLRELKRVYNYLKTHIDEGFEKITDPAAVKLVRQAVKEAGDGVRTVRAIGEDVGTVWRDITFYNYGDKRNYDKLFRSIWAYPHWYSRQAMRTLYRHFENPHGLVSLHKAKETLTQMNQDLPEWLQGHVSRVLGDGGLLSLDVFRYVDPSDGLHGEGFYDPTITQYPSGKIYTLLNDLGPGSLHTGIAPILGQIASAQGNHELARAYGGRIGLTTSFIGDAWSAGMTHGLPYLAEQGIVPDINYGQASDMLTIERALPLAVYQYMSIDTPEGKKFIGSKWDRNKVNKILNEKYKSGQITEEMLVDVLALADNPFNPNWTGPNGEPQNEEAWQVFTDAIEEMRKRKILHPNGMPGSELLSYAVGPAPRVQTADDVELQQIAQTYREVREKANTILKEGAPGAITAAQNLIEEFWRDPRHDEYSHQLFGRMTPGRDKDSAYTWKVLSRTGPGIIDNELLKQTGAAVNKQLLGEFYAAGGIPDKWENDTYQKFMGDIRLLNSKLKIPDASTKQEWNQVIDLYKDVYANKIYGTVQDKSIYYTAEDIIDDFEEYKFNNTQKHDAAWLDEHPEVVDLIALEWDELQKHPTLLAYYVPLFSVRDNIVREWKEEHAEGEKLLETLAGLKALNPAVGNEMFYANQDAIEAHREARNLFYKTDLPKLIKEWGDDLPNPKHWHLRMKVLDEKYTPEEQRDIFTSNLLEIKREESSGTSYSPSQSVTSSDVSDLPSDELLAEYEKYKDLPSQTYIDKGEEQLTTNIENLVKALGLNQATWNSYKDTPIYDKFPTSAKGIEGVVAYVQQSGTNTIREALFAETNGNFEPSLFRFNQGWRVLGTIKELHPNELASLKARYPELADIEMVWWANYAEPSPTLEVLFKSMGVKATMSSDGKVNITKANNLRALTPEEYTEYLEEQEEELEEQEKEARQEAKDESIFGRLVVDEDDRFISDGDVHNVVYQVASEYIEKDIDLAYGVYQQLLMTGRADQAQALYEANPNIKKFQLLQKGLFEIFKFSKYVPGSKQWNKWMKEMGPLLQSGGIDALLAKIEKEGIGAVPSLVDTPSKKKVSKYSGIFSQLKTSKITTPSFADFHPQDNRQPRRKAAQPQPPPKGVDTSAWMNIWREWQKSKNPLLVLLMDYFDLSAYAKTAHLQRNPNLARWLATMPSASLAAIERGYFVWAQKTGRITPRQERRIQKSRPNLATTLRVYKPRGVRAGL